MLGQRELTPEDYVAILRRRWPLIAVLTVLGGILGYGITPLLPKKYTSKTLVLVQQPTVGPDYVRPLVTQDTNQRLASMQQEILSRTRLASIIERVGLFREEGNGANLDGLVGRLRDAIEVTPVAPMAQTGRGQLPGFTIGVTFPDPKLAQQICATVTSMFTEANLKLRQQQAEQTTEFLGKQLEEAKGRLDEQDSKLATFQRRNLGSLPGDEQGNLNLLTNLTAQLDATTQTLSRAQQDKTYAEAMLDQQTAAARATPDGPSPESYDQQLAALQAQLTSLKSKYTDNHPDVVKLKNSIEALKRKVVEAPKQTESAEVELDAPLAESAAIRSLKTQVFQLEQTIKEKTAEQRDLQQRIKLYQSRVESSPAIIQEYKELTRDYQTAVDSHNDLLRKLEQSELATALERQQQGEQFQVLDPANLPTVPSFPNKTLFSLGGLGGGVALGVGLVLLLEIRDQSFRSERDVEALLRIPVLAVVSAVKVNADRKSSKPVESAAGA